MEIKTHFEMSQRVRIKDLNIIGRVIAVWFESKIQIRVRFWLNGDLKELYFFEDELEPA